MPGVLVLRKYVAPELLILPHELEHGITITIFFLIQLDELHQLSFIWLTKSCLLLLNILSFFTGNCEFNLGFICNSKLLLFLFNLYFQALFSLGGSKSELLLLFNLFLLSILLYLLNLFDFLQGPSFTD